MKTESYSVIEARRNKAVRRQELITANMVKCRTKGKQLDEAVEVSKQKVELAQEKFNQIATKKGANDAKIERLQEDLSLLEKKIKKYSDLLAVLPKEEPAPATTEGEKSPDATTPAPTTPEEPVQVPPQLL